MSLPTGQEVLTIVTCSAQVTFALICKTTIVPSTLASFLGAVGTLVATSRSAAQEAYNDAHAKTRVVIEQTFGRWKRRFHVLYLEIRMAPEKVCMTVGVCAVLHNIALQLHEPMGG